MDKLAIIGCGFMGSAIAKGLAKDQKNLEVLVYDLDVNKLNELEGGNISSVSLDEAIKADSLLIAVKPHILPAFASDVLKIGRIESKRVISVMAGKTLDSIKVELAECITEDTELVRVMPNLAASVGYSSSGIYSSSSQAAKIIAELFKSIGDVFLLGSEDEVDIFTAISGSGPAFIYEAISGMIDGAVKAGMPRDKATAILSSVLTGSAKLLKSEGVSPSQIRDRVTSAGGTTIYGLYELQEGAIQSSFIRAVESAVLRAKELSS